MSMDLTLRVFIHNDLADYNKDDLYETYFAQLAQELESIAGEKISILLISPPNAGLHDHPYKDPYASGTLRTWRAKVDNYRRTLPDAGGSTRHNKYLLLTRDPLFSTILGIANQAGYTAIASIARTYAPAHEVGHMFNATHEDSDVVYNGWWNDTNMRSDVLSQLRGNAGRFSDKNRENISQYLDDFEFSDYGFSG